ncbi:hypothetical protein [Nocardioides sp. zg-DK7169]|uniref:hypothetical protein n=1 Tax=Nocardioides sp. zg-DK7169 TaxID=2736600 RepID=UPI001554FD8A|nr:hypothetical protein [Nocardioides sp. zg-DK7169]NPC95281.1 hypothetical protein [Nocardioides sp. zg-DK7169]
MKNSLARLRGARDARTRRLQDSAATRRRRRLAGAVLLAVGLATLVFGVAAGRADAPPQVQLATEGVTQVPSTRFFQSPWVLYGQVDDPRRTPSLDEVGCRPESGLDLPAQPEDLTTFGSRVVDGVPVAAIALLGHSDDGAAIACTGASDHAPLWLMPSSDAPPFTATSIVILGVLLLVAGALVQPARIERRAA